jgi:ketosteroid isomerase-like protein
MNKRDPKLTALLFNECINNQDIDGLVALMTEDHSLVCNAHVDTQNKDSSREVWSTFFSMYPDYLNHFSRLDSKDDFVVITGKSTCSNEARLNTNALWSAKVLDDKIAEWQVYEDNSANRRKLHIQ